MAKKRFSDREEMLIVGKYKGGVPTNDIMAEFDIPASSSLYRILKRHGAYDAKGRNEKWPKCVCGHKNPRGSKFCNQCGKSLKTDEELILEGLLNARSKCLRYVNRGVRDDVDRQILAAVELIRKTFNIKE